jgi:hypothetical protein
MQVRSKVLMCLVVSSGREIPKAALQAAASKITAKLVSNTLFVTGIFRT